MRTEIAFCFCILLFVNCGSEKSAPTTTAVAASGSGGNVDAGATANQQLATTSAPLTVAGSAAATVTRHLPGTAITTATGKYTYLVQSDGSIASFISDAVATASGYPTAMIITVSAAELYCYGRGDQITAALPAPKAGKLRDGTLVKEKGKSDTYVVSDSAAWPVMNGNVFAEAGYDWGNVIEISAGTLVKSVEAVGDCVAGIACLDEAYLTSCSQDIVNNDPPTSTSTPTATATATAPTTSNQQPTTNVTRHLPGTAITTATGKYTYLVQSDGTIASFASDAIASASGYPTAMIITVSTSELYCYGRGDQITTALPAPVSGKLRDGTLVKENGKPDTYVVSDGLAWPVMNGNVFTEAGYAWENVIEIASGTLAASVDSVGNCVTGIACLDEAYLTSCSQDETIAPLSTSTATSVATSTPVATATATATATTIQTSLTITTVNTGSAIATSTGTATNTQSATTTASPDAAPSAVNNPDASVDVSVDTRAPQDAVTATVTVTNNQQPGTIDLSWVYAALGSQLCLNAAYFDGNNKAVLLVWSGPGADSFKGSVAAQTNDRFCWEFAGKGKGLYYFWADAPDPACSAAVCQRDGIDGNGAIYMTAPKASVAARKWLHCEPTGCDGAAYWDGTMLTPMGD
jgi:hypothetical protein